MKTCSVLSLRPPPTKKMRRCFIENLRSRELLQWKNVRVCHGGLLYVILMHLSFIDINIWVSGCEILRCDDGLSSVLREMLFFNTSHSFNSIYIESQIRDIF